MPTAAVARGTIRGNEEVGGHRAEAYREAQKTLAGAQFKSVELALLALLYSYASHNPSRHTTLVLSSAWAIISLVHRFMHCLFRGCLEVLSFRLVGPVLGA